MRLYASLNAVTDIEVVRPVAPRGGPLFFLFLAALALAASPASAREPARQPAKDRRVIAIRNSSDQPVVYGTPGVPVRLVFDAPLGKGPFVLPGARVQPHPVLANALVVTPTRALAKKRDPVRLTVPLASGTVTVGIAVREVPDRRVDLARAGVSSLASRRPPPEVQAFCAAFSR